MRVRRFLFTRHHLHVVKDSEIEQMATMPEGLTPLSIKERTVDKRSQNLAAAVYANRPKSNSRKNQTQTQNANRPKSFLSV